MKGNTCILSYDPDPREEIGFCPIQYVRNLYVEFTTDQRIYIYLSWKRSVYDMECFYYGFLIRFFTTDLLRINAFTYTFLGNARSMTRNVFTMDFYYGFLLRIYYESTHLHIPFLETLGL